VAEMITLGRALVEGEFCGEFANSIRAKAPSSLVLAVSRRYRLAGGGVAKLVEDLGVVGAANELKEVIGDVGVRKGDESCSDFLWVGLSNEEGLEQWSLITGEACGLLA